MGDQLPAFDPQWWDLASNVVAGVIGALAGGIPAYFLAKRSAKETLRRDREARTDAQKVAAYRVLVKLIVIVNSVLSIEQHFRSMLADTAVGSEDEPWQRVQAISGISDEEGTKFDADEVAVFLAAGAGDYLNDLLLLPRRHAAIISSLREYAERRRDLAETVPVAAFAGEIGQSYLTEEQVKKLRPRTIALNSLIRGIAERLTEDRPLALRLARDFGPITRKFFNDPKFPSFDLSEVPTSDGAAEAVAKPAP